MTRKDTILIAVVINAGLLAILFTTAVIYDADKASDPIEMATTIGETGPGSTPPSPELVAEVPSTGDEVDNVLKYYSIPSSKPIAVNAAGEDHVIQETGSQIENASKADPVPIKPVERPGNFVEITVKKGDVLEKIARAHHSTVNAIKKANNLKNENLSIGQVLKVPVKKIAPTVVQSDSASKQNAQDRGEGDSARDPVYHIIKSGDNPWNIAKEHHVKYDDILRLNHLDEEKARNLKIGDKIRVK